jgi:hypothetical protein
VRELLGRTQAEYDGLVIVPITLVDPGYYREIVGGLRDGSAGRTITWPSGCVCLVGPSSPSRSAPAGRPWRAWLRRYATTVRDIHWN